MKAPIRPPAWELPYAAHVALKSKKKKEVTFGILKSHPFSGETPCKSPRLSAGAHQMAGVGCPGWEGLCVFHVEAGQSHGLSCDAAGFRR